MDLYGRLRDNSTKAAQRGCRDTNAVRRTDPITLVLLICFLLLGTDLYGLIRTVYGKSVFVIVFFFIQHKVVEG